MEKLFYLGLNLPFSHVCGFVGALLFLYMSLWSLLAIAKKRADLADLAWGPGFMIVAWASFILGDATLDGCIVNILITFWAIRLALHIYMRNRKRNEDFRYQALKSQWKNNLNLRLFTHVFLLQGCILYIVALPLVWIHTHAEGLPRQILWMILPVWLVGFAIETIADLQLAFFKKNPINKGKLLTAGLWGYVRHPNYLGELIQWWAIWLIAAFLPYGWTLVISPLLLTFLIVNISGVKPLEEKWMKQAAFKLYLKNTPALIPPTLVNGILYTVAWFVLVVYGVENPIIFSLITVLGYYVVQMYLFAKFDQLSLRICLPLSIIALCLGLLQEMLLIQFKVLVYPHNGNFIPIWILALYPLFSLTLNSSLAFLNKRLLLSFFLGGSGAILSYLSGQSLCRVQLLSVIAYPIIFLSWGVLLTLLILFNRKLIAWQSHR